MCSNRFETAKVHRILVILRHEDKKVKYLGYWLVVGGAGGEFFAGFGPGVDPGAAAAGEGVAGGGEDVADVADGEGVELFALGIAGVVP